MTLPGTVINGVVILDPGLALPEGTRVEVTIAAPPPAAKKPRTSLARWAQANAEHWGDRLRSEDVESFTGRRY